MYIAALYKDNWGESREKSGIEPQEKKVDWAGIKTVDVPEMKLYEVEYYQDVSAYRDIYFDVWASDEEFADMGASHDFYYDDETFTEIEVGDVDYGDYGDVYDTTIEISDKDPSEFGDTFRRLENKNIIKKILNEYRKKI